MPRIDSKQFYLSSIQKYGTTAQGVHWLSQESQELRFDIILNMLPDNITSLVDAGCGFGDFYHYIDKQNKKPQQYIGVDSLHKMCTIATKNTKQEIIYADITRDSLPSAEYYVCSGAMNFLSSFETHLFIRNCFSSSTKAFIFNVLYGDSKSTTYNYLTKQNIQEIAKKLHVKEISLHENYMKDDITVGFYH